MTSVSTFPTNQIPTSIDTTDGPAIPETERYIELSSRTGRSLIFAGGICDRDESIIHPYLIQIHKFRVITKCMNGPALQPDLSEGKIRVNAELRDRAESVGKLGVLTELLVLELPEVDIELYDVPEMMPIVDGVSIPVLTLLTRLAWWMLDRLEVVWTKYGFASGKDAGVGSATATIE